MGYVNYKLNTIFVLQMHRMRMDGSNIMWKTGAIREGGGQSKTLRNVTVPVITNEKCEEKGYKGRITENMLCAGDFENGGRDACQVNA